MCVKKVCGIIIFIGLLVGACSPKPMVSNLHKGPYGYDKAPDGILQVSVGILPIVRNEPEQVKPRMYWDLRDSLPHILTKTFAATAKPEDILKLMNGPIPSMEKKEVPKLPTDYTQYKVLITFSNIKRYFSDSRFIHPNTRLEFLNMRLSLPDASNFSFYNIDKLVNEYEEIDLGSLERNETITFGGKLTAQGDLGSSFEMNTGNTNQRSQDRSGGHERAVYDSKGNEIGSINSAGEYSSSYTQNNGTKSSTAAKVSASAEANYQNTESIKEAIAVKLRRMKTGFSFSGKSITVSQRGRIGGDISDNVYVTATLKFTATRGVDSKDVFNFSNLFNENLQAVAADQLNFNMRNVNYVKCESGNAVTLNTKYEGAIRAVGNANGKTGENSMEYDDYVTYYRIDNTDGDALEINQNVFCKKVYKIVAKDVGGNKYTLRIAAPTDTELDLFSDDAPQYFLQWLIDAMNKADKKFLSTNKFRIYFEDPNSRKRIYIVKDGVTDADVTDIKTLLNIQAELR